MKPYLLLLPILILAAGLLLINSATQTPQQLNQQAAKPTSILNPQILNLLPKKSIRHPLHIHAFKHLQTLSAAAITQQITGFTPAQIKSAYHLPSTGGIGTIAIVDAYFTSNLQQDLAMFDNAFNLPPCSTSNGCLTIQFENNTQPTAPPAGTNWDIETTMDVEWAHAIAPNSKIMVYEATSDQPVDLLTGVNAVRNLAGVKSVSMSWVAPEFAAEASFENIFTSQQGASFFAASGDTGSGANWPAVSANVIGVGGTTLTLDSNNNAVNETAWSGSGGGISQFITEPSYQTNFNVPHTNGKRASPDISMNANPDLSPYIIIFNGNVGAVGGTSVGTPVWAAMNTLSQGQTTNNLLYQNAQTAYSIFYRDITQGSNGTCATYCTAAAGYDYVTGLGSPIALPQNPPATSTPTSSPTSNQTPTAVTSPTVQPNSFSFFLTILLHGIGQGGDNANLNSGGNPNPLHPTRNISLTLLQPNSTPLVSQQGAITFNSQTGIFTGTVNISNIFPGNYLAQVKVAGFLSKQIPGFIQIQPSPSNLSLPQVALTNGDVNNDNQLDLLDYNDLLACFGTKATTCTNSATADLNDDGVVDGIDYNLFLRELSVQKGG